MSLLGKIGSNVFFAGFQEKNNADYRMEVWKYNGTSSSLITNLHPTGDGFMGQKAGIMGNYLYYSGDNGTVKGLFKTDGSTTTLVKEIPNLIGNLEYLELNGVLYFVVDKASGSAELWKSDGTTAGTSLLTDLILSPSKEDLVSMHVLNGECFVHLAVLDFEDQPVSVRLWKSNGTVGGTVQLHAGGMASAIDLDEVNYEYQNGASVLNNELYFLGVDSNHGYEIWKTDGTVAGTQLAVDLNIGKASSYPSQFVRYNDEIILAANNGIYGQELFKLSTVNPCPEQLNPVGTVSGNLSANLTISTGTPNDIQNGSNVTYQAGQYIQLNPGFKTGTNTVFLTKLMGGCP